MPPTTALGPLHVPPACGVPPRLLIKLTGAPELQAVRDPFVPAFGAALSATVTVAASLTHGATAVSVYV